MASNNPSNPAIPAIVLAAGSSSRFGATKLIADFHGKPLVQHVLLAAQAACGGLVTLVVGYDRDAVIAAANGIADTIVTNVGFQNGLGSSIAAGIHSVRHNADAVLVILADQPLLTGQQLESLVAVWSGSPDEIVASTYAGVTGPPVLFPRNTFDRLETLTGDIGARQVLSDRSYRVTTLPVPEAGFDIDTRGDLETL